MVINSKHFKTLLILIIVLTVMGGCDLFFGKDPVVADFSWGHAVGTDGLTIQFLDLSTSTKSSKLEYSWEFGDGNNSTEKNPVNKYAQEGEYLVSLTVTSGGVIPESDTIEKIITLPITSLQPGHVFVGEDGVSLAAPNGVIEEAIVVNINKVQDPRAEIEFPEYLGKTEVIGDFYQLTSEKDIITSVGDYLLLGLPVPEGENVEDLAVVVLSPLESIVMKEPVTDQSIRWEIVSGFYDQASGLFGTLVPFIGVEQHIFALVRGGFHVLQFPLPDKFKVVAIGFGEGECPPEHIEMTETALNRTYQVMVENLGYNEPRLREVIVEIKFTGWPTFYEIDTRYEYQLRKGGVNGWYNSTQSTAATTYPGYPAEPLSFIARHELYHALQYGYDAFFQNRTQRNFGVVEGTAVASEFSLQGLTRSDAALSSREALDISRSLFQNTAPNVANMYDYRTQDFWVYVGKRINPVNPNVGSFIPVFEKGGLINDIDEFLVEEGTFASLGDAYWQWAKNQAFEKNVILGLDRFGNTIPSGEPGVWSEHGILRNLTYNPSFWESAAPVPFSMVALYSRVYRINFFPLEEDYKTIVNVEGGSGLKWKAYPEDIVPQSQNLEWLSATEGYLVNVGSDGAVVYLLISNTNHQSTLHNVEISFTAPIRDNLVEYIDFYPQSPALIPVGNNVNFICDYQTYHSEGVRIFARPFTEGSLTPNYSAHSSPVYPLGLGEASGHFTVLTPAIVDQVRFRMETADTATLLYEEFVPVHFEFYDHLIKNIFFTPESPNTVYVGDNVSFSFSYYTIYENGIRIFGRPFTDGALTPGYIGHASAIYDDNTGRGTGYFSLSSPNTVDQVRFQIWDQNNNLLLYEMFVDVNYQFVSKHEITNITLSPPSPGQLYVGDNVTFNFSYFTSEQQGVRIFGRPFTDGALTPDYAAHGSPLYPAGHGKGSGYFTITTPGEVDQIRFRMWDEGQENLLYEKFIDVNYYFSP